MYKHETINWEKIKKKKKFSFYRIRIFTNYIYIYCYKVYHCVKFFKQFFISIKKAHHLAMIPQMFIFLKIPYIFLLFRDYCFI